MNQISVHPYFCVTFAHEADFAHPSVCAMVRMIIHVIVIKCKGTMD